MSIAPSWITCEQLLALPEDGLERELIRGVLRERPMTRRNRFHAAAEAKIVHLLLTWLGTRPEPRGAVCSGEIGCILRRDPDTIVGIDVAYFSAEVVARQNATSTMMEGSPRLAVEILSPSDRMEEVHEKVAEYLAAGVDLIWVVDPFFRTVQVHCRHTAPEMFNADQTLRGGDILPGLSISVAEIFGN